MARCPRCLVEVGNECPDCGWRAARAGSDKPVRMIPAREHCDCGAALYASGLCAEAGGYPATAALTWWQDYEHALPQVYRFTCPHCRGPLDWSGGCERCHGCTTGRRDDWAFPGDRYELEKGHWQCVASGPRPACPPAANAAGLAEVRALLATMPALTDRPQTLSQRLGMRGVAA